jgi:hypothetical protein
MLLDALGSKEADHETTTGRSRRGRAALFWFAPLVKTSLTHLPTDKQADIAHRPAHLQVRR